MSTAHGKGGQTALRIRKPSKAYTINANQEQHTLNTQHSKRASANMQQVSSHWMFDGQRAVRRSPRKNKANYAKGRKSDFSMASPPRSEHYSSRTNLAVVTPRTRATAQWLSTLKHLPAAHLSFQQKATNNQNQKVTKQESKTKTNEKKTKATKSGSAKKKVDQKKNGSSDNNTKKAKKTTSTTSGNKRKRKTTNDSGKATTQTAKKKGRKPKTPGTSSNASTAAKRNTESNSKTGKSGTPSSGRWTNEEHQIFLEGLQKFGKEWKKISEMIKTRTVVQTRTHAQKYFQKLLKIDRMKTGKVNPGFLSIAKSKHKGSFKALALSKGDALNLTEKLENAAKDRKEGNVLQEVRKLKEKDKEQKVSDTGRGKKRRKKGKRNSPKSKKAKEQTS
eukprot:g2766.t1